MFVGGSGGNLDEIIKYFSERGEKKSVIVINIIALETLSKVQTLFEKYKIKNMEIINVSVSRGKKIGGYTMMYGENPIYIIRGEKGEEVNE